MKKLSIKQKKFKRLLEDFDQAAQNWGWTADQGLGKFVETSKEHGKKQKKN